MCFIFVFPLIRKCFYLGRRKLFYLGGNGFFQAPGQHSVFFSQPFLALLPFNARLFHVNFGTGLVVFSLLLDFLLLAQLSSYPGSYCILLSINIGWGEPNGQDAIVSFVAIELSIKPFNSFDVP